MNLLLDLWAWLTGTSRRASDVEASSRVTSRREPPVLTRYLGQGDPPPGQWKACHPSTILRFKAEVTCPFGHGMVLKGHSISEHGYVLPSVVCPKKGCTFHDFVKLEGWTFGAVR